MSLRAISSFYEFFGGENHIQDSANHGAVNYFLSFPGMSRPLCEFFFDRRNFYTKLQQLI